MIPSESWQGRGWYGKNKTTGKFQLFSGMPNCSLFERAWLWIFDQATFHGVDSDTVVYVAEKP